MVSDGEFSSNCNEDSNNDDLEMVIYVQKDNKSIRLRMRAKFQVRVLQMSGNVG